MPVNNDNRKKQYAAQLMFMYRPGKGIALKTAVCTAFRSNNLN